MTPSTAVSATTPTRSGSADGNDLINEAVNAASGGTADRISIQAPNAVDASGQPIIDPVTLLPVPTITALDAFDSSTATQTGDLVINYSLPTGPTGSVAQSITVAGHFTGNNAQTGVERINFNGATFAGYALGAEDYFISRSDPADRAGGDVDMSLNAVTNTQANFVVGEQGVDDEITGGGLNDLIFGGTGNDDLVGGLGDDLLVGGAGNDDLDARLNLAGDDFEGAVGADTMVGGAGNDTYGIDDLLDVAIESPGRGHRHRRDLPGRAFHREHGQRREPHPTAASTPTSSSAPATPATTSSPAAIWPTR